MCVCVCVPQLQVLKYRYIYLLTSWSRVLLENLTGSAASEEIPRIFGTRRFITVLTSARHLSLSSANSIQSSQPPPTSWRYMKILSSHLRLGLSSGLFPSGFPTRTLCTPHPYAPLLRLGRPVDAVTLSRWEWWWDERWIWGARGGLKPNFYQLPRPWSPWASFPFKEKSTR